MTASLSRKFLYSDEKSCRKEISFKFLRESVEEIIRHATEDDETKVWVLGTPRCKLFYQFCPIACSISYSSGRKGSYDFEAFFFVNESLRAGISHDSGWSFSL